MKKILCLIISVCVLFALCSCDKQKGSDTLSSANGENVSQNSKDEFLDFSDNNYNGITNSDILAQDDNYYYLKQKVSSKDANINFDTFKIDVKDSSGNEITYFMYMDDKYGYYCRSNEDLNTTGEIGRVNIENNTYEKLIDIPVGNQGGGVVASDKYIVWKESLDKSNWGKTRLNIYDIEQKVNKVFFTHSVETDTGRVYALTDSPCVINGDLVYFDDVVAIKDGIRQTNIYSYNVKTSKLSLVKEMAEIHSETSGGFIYKELRSDQENTTVGLYKEGSAAKLLSFKNSSNGEFVVTQNTNIAKINWLSNNGLNSADCHGVQLYSNNKISQLLVTKECVYIGQLVTDGNVILFGIGDKEQKPLMFDVKADKFIELDCNKGKCCCKISKSYGYFYSPTQDGMEIIRMPLS